MQSFKLFQQSGFTLIELMVVLVIAAILITIGVPSFEEVTKRNTVESLQSRLASAIATARTEAASRNTTVTICNRKVADDTCGGSWNDGWVVFEDKDNDQTIDTDEIVIDIYEHTNAYTFAFDNSVTDLSFNAQGFMTGVSEAVVKVCEPDKGAAYVRGLYISASGLVIKSRDGSDDGSVHDHPTADPAADLSC